MENTHTRSVELRSWSLKLCEFICCKRHGAFEDGGGSDKGGQGEDEQVGRLHGGGLVGVKEFRRRRAREERRLEVGV